MVLGSENMHEGPDEHQRYLAAVRRIVETLPSDAQSGPNAKHADAMMVERVKSPEAAQRLSRRHQDHFLPPRLIPIVRDLLKNQQDESAKARYTALCRSVKEHGMFIMPYSPAFMTERIAMDGRDGGEMCLIVEVSAKHPDSNHPRASEVSPAADAQFILPMACVHAQHVVHLPEQDDEVASSDQMVDVRSRPWAVASFEDLACDREMFRLSCAKRAANEGIRMIRNDINPTRGEFPIEFIAAEIAVITGLVLRRNEAEFVRASLYEDCGKMMPVKNDRSLEVVNYICDAETHDAFGLAFTRKQKVVPVDSDPLVAGLIVDWMVQYARLRP